MTITEQLLSRTASPSPANVSAYSGNAEKLLTRRQLVEFLNGEGFPMGFSTLQKYCSPAINCGPPIEAWWGRLPMYRPSRALEWARARLRPATAAAEAA